jgi:hypothetical protein
LTLQILYFTRKPFAASPSDYAPICPIFKDRRLDPGQSASLPKNGTNKATARQP